MPRKKKYLIKPREAFIGILVSATLILGLYFFGIVPQTAFTSHRGILDLQHSINKALYFSNTDIEATTRITTSIDEEKMKAINWYYIDDTFISGKIYTVTADKNNPINIRKDYIDIPSSLSQGIHTFTIKTQLFNFATEFRGTTSDLQFCSSELNTIERTTRLQNFNTIYLYEWYLLNYLPCDQRERVYFKTSNEEDSGYYVTWKPITEDYSNRLFTQAPGELTTISTDLEFCYVTCDVPEEEPMPPTEEPPIEEEQPSQIFDLKLIIIPAVVLSMIGLGFVAYKRIRRR